MFRTQIYIPEEIHLDADALVALTKKNDTNHEKKVDTVSEIALEDKNLADNWFCRQTKKGYSILTATIWPFWSVAKFRRFLALTRFTKKMALTFASKLPPILT